MKNMIIAATLLTLSACSKNNTGNTDEPSTGVSPVETNAPNANYPPAFAGQTRISGVRNNYTLPGNHCYFSFKPALGHRLKLLTFGLNIVITGSMG